jgi:amino acid transporter
MLQDQMAPYRTRTTAVVITTAMLTFISFWRAGAIVLCDLASTAYYVAGIAEHAIGEAAPWLICIVLIFAMGVRGMYIESCGMFVRGGVYRVVKEAMGSNLAKIAVSALVFDFILTGPISSVSAGQYLVGYLNTLLQGAGYAHLQIPTNFGAMLFGIVITLYFWRKNVLGIKESSGKALRILQITGCMVVVLIAWGLLTWIMGGHSLPDMSIKLNDDSLGWLAGIPWVKSFALFGIIIGLGHSILAMSGEETLAQVYREIEYPKMRNLKRAAVLIFIVSFCFTGGVSFLAVTIIPDSIRPEYADNLISGLVTYLVGPGSLKFVFEGVVVVVGAIILAGAVNTAIIGSNGVLNRVAEDGVLSQWFRGPHRRYGTTYRMMTFIVGWQILIIILSQGNIFYLGEAYAFGVVWSFTFETLAVLVLRFKRPGAQDWKFPVNLRIGKLELPIGLMLLFGCLFIVAITNLFTKTAATKAGIAFTMFFTTVLFISEKHMRKKAGEEHKIEKVNVAFSDTVTAESCGCDKEKKVLVSVRDPHSLYQLKRTLEMIDKKTTDVVVLTVETLQVPTSGGLEAMPKQDQELLTNIVTVAEKYGTHVKPIVVPSKDPTYATAKVAFEIGAEEIVVGRSEQVSPEVQLERLALAWGFAAKGSGRTITVRIVWPQHELKYEIS